MIYIYIFIKYTNHFNINLIINKNKCIHINVYKNVNKYQYKFRNKYIAVQFCPLFPNAESSLNHKNQSVKSIKFCKRNSKKGTLKLAFPTDF